MSRKWLLLLVLAAVGCSGQADRGNPAQRGGGDPRSVTAPSTAAARKPSVSELDAQIETMIAQANQLEAEYRFQQATGVWRQIHQLTSQRFGSLAWQTTNARLAAQTAEKQAKLNQAQRQSLNEIKQLQQSAGLAIEQGNNDEALQLVERVIVVTHKLFGENSHLMARLYFQRGTILQHLGRQSDAIESLAFALQTSLETMGPIHPEIEMIQHRLALLYQSQAKLDLAFRHMLEAEVQARQIWGTNHEAYAVRANDLGVICHLRGELNRALMHLDLALSIRRRHLGPDHLQVGHSLQNIGVVHMDRADWPAAETNLAQACQVFQNCLGEDNPVTQDAQFKLATVLMVQKKPQQAEEILQAAVDRMSQGPTGSPELAKRLFQLSVCQCQLAKYDLAEPQLDAALKIQLATLGAGHTDTQNTIDALALLYQRTGRPDRAENMRTAAASAEDSGQVLHR